MVQILPQFDPGGQIGQSIGGGFGDALKMLGQRDLARGSLDKAMAAMKPTPQLDEKGQPMVDKDGKPIMQRKSPMETFGALGSALVGIPGGMQLMGEMFPVIRDEMIRESQMEQLQGRDRRMPSPEPEGEQKEPTISEMIDERRSSYMATGMTADKAMEAAMKEVSLESGKQQQVHERLGKAGEYFDRRYQESFGEDGLDSQLLASFRNDFTQDLQRSEPDVAWKNVMPKYRAAQIEIGNLRKAPGRALWGSAEDSIKKGRELIPKLIEIDPELARSTLQSEFDLGESEASQAVKPGGKKYEQFRKNFSGKYRQDLSKLGLFPEDVSDAKGGVVPLPQSVKKVEEKQFERLKKFLSRDFDTETDSLLALRGELLDDGVDSDVFLRAVNEAFPEGEDDKRLSTFNKNELPRLSKSANPGLGEIFRGLFQGKFEPATRARKKKLRGKV